MSGIELKSINKNFGDKTVLKDISLNIKEKSFTVLLGPSGCGKSTLLRIISGLEHQDSGSVFINGKCVDNAKPGKRKIAMVFQNYALYPTMSVRENIEFGLKNKKIPKEKRNTLIEEIMTTVGLQEHQHKKPQYLSGGERQRVALARAMVKEPDVFLMDEPLSNLDAKLRNQMRRELIELHKKTKATFIYVTHDQLEAMSMGTDVALLNAGTVQQFDTPLNIYQDPANIFTAKFLGNPSMNIFKVADNFPLKELIQEGEFIGFRPEKVKIIEIEKSEKEKSLYLNGEIIIREMLGSESIYDIETEMGIIRVKLQEENIFKDKVKLKIKYKNIVVFDKEKNHINTLDAYINSEGKNHEKN
ncbi:MAG: ABC transporter ATP-binding protein [Spirochaetales bacterium]|nr:ABC transporter ATP-binding protein [Spirochaetales bacterium]